MNGIDIEGGGGDVARPMQPKVCTVAQIVIGLEIGGCEVLQSPSASRTGVGRPPQLTGKNGCH